MTQYESSTPIDDATLPFNDNASAVASGDGPEKAVFDYQDIPEKDRDEIFQIVEEIKNARRIHKKAEFKAVVEYGLRLSRVRGKFPRKWGHWLACEFEWTQKTAENYMIVAQHSDQIVTVTNLDLSAAYVLFAKSTPADIQDELLARAKTGEHISRKVVKERIAKGKGAARKPVPQEKKAEPGEAMKVETATADDSAMKSESATTEAETSPATGKSPGEEIADALMNLLSMVEKNKPRCKPDDVAVFFMNDDHKRVALANTGSFAFVSSITEALLRMPEPEVQLKIAS